MESPRPKNLSVCRKKSIEELKRGRKFASELQIILRKCTGDHGSVKAEELVAKILKSFTEALAILSSGESGEVCEDLATVQAGLLCCDDQKTEGSGENRKRPASVDHPIGGYTRRKMSETWTKITLKPVEDSHSWRKYGQKEILNAKYPRSYFRCTRRHDQGCQATKQVQKTEDETPMYQTTYIGHHTCQDVFKAPQFIIDDIPREAILFSFESNPATKQELPSFSYFPSVKQEYKKEASALCDSKTHNNQSSLESLLWSDLPSIKSGPTLDLPSTPGSDYGDASGVYSCTTSSYSSFDMDLDSIHRMVVGSVDFDNFWI
ncbi:hypothetical protein NE237_004817 [Protea cynaroides]|uniref:WRKY domain-containing protein n=1 Tax=Protea cynaroides TaxID=273540 RepID=A0A9Q0KJA8_9MAGN|nr:hypothetical protein NE237_004817 [Protea cynaroides]